MSDFDPRPSHAIPARDGNYLPATVSPANVPMGMPMSAAPWMDSSEPKSGFNIISFLHSLRRRWLMGLGLGFLVSSIIAALLWLLVPVKYEALAQLRIHRNPPELLRDKFARPQLPQDFEITKQTQAALIRSPRVLEAALREPGIAQLPLVRDEPWFGERDNPVAWLDRQLKIEFAPNSELLQISMKERRPDDLKKVLEAVIKSYDTEIVKREQMERNDRFTKLKNRHRELQTEVSTQWSEFGELAKTYGSQESEAVKTKIEIETRQLSDVARQRQQVEQQLFEAQADYMMLQHRLLASQSTQPDNWQLEEALNMYPEYRLFNEQKIQLEQAISFSQPQGGAGRSMGGGQLQQLQTQLATVNQKMEEFRYSHRNEAVQRVKQADNTDERKIQQEFSAKQQILRMLEQRRAALDAEQKRLADTLLAANRFSADMMVRQNQLKSDEDTLDSIKQELERLQLEMDNATQVDIITHATIPDESNWIAKYMQIIAAWGLSLIGTILGLALWDMQHQRVNSTQEVLDSGEVRVIGTLPSLSNRWAAGLLPLSESSRRVAEVSLTRATDSIRTALQFARRQHAYQVIMVSSALGQEGKTTVASQLAVSFARSGRRTLLIDGDVRNPQQHVVLGMPMSHGLCEVLRSEMNLEDVIEATPAEGLWSISAGHRDFNTDQYLASAVVGKIFQELRSRFDAIVIDTGPVLTCPDAMLLGQYADAAVISVRRDVSRLPKVSEACDRLRSVGIHIAGVVLNGAPSDVRDSELQITAQPAGPQLEKV